MSNALSPTQQFPQQTIELGSNPTQLNGSIGVGINGLELPANSEPASLHRLAIANLSLESQTLEQTALTSSPLWSQPWQEIALTSPLADATATGSHIDALLPQNSANGSQPLVGILDTGFDLSRSGLPGESQIYLGYDWVEGDRNPLVTDHSSTSHGNQVLEAFSQAASSNAPASIWLGRAVGSGDWAASLVEFVATAQALGHPNAVANLSFDLTEVQADGSIIPRNNLSENEIAALEFARQQGIIVVAASGNNNADLSALAQAAQQFDNVLTVGAAEQAGLDINRASYSNYGEGLSLLAEVPGNLAGSPQGTSLAATQVTQAVQTLWQRHSHLSYSQVTNLLESSATDLQAPGWDNETGHGLLNLDQALRDASQQSTVQDGIASSQIEAPFLATAPNPWDFTSNNPQHLERALALDVAQVTPGDGTTNIDTQASIRVQFASEAIDPNSLTSDSFQLVDDDGTAIAASIGSDITGGVISLTPQGPLDPFSTYSIVITADLLNDQGEAATPFSTSFTTGAQGSSPAGLRFNNQAALSGESRFGVSSIAVGPDGNVYASDITGNVLRYNLDPSTGLATSTDTVFAQSGAQIVGIAFDPNATATDLQLWITYAEQDNSGFSGTISKLALPAVSGGTTTKQDYITGLPNSIGLPHQPNGIAFGSDGKLYQTVGGVATLGGTANWGVDESPLSAAVIVADVNSANFPTNQTGSAVDVQTVGLDTDGDPTTENYDPAAANAPVQLFATGLRNAYDLAWHSNGNLYSGINQNSIGGSVFTPQSPDGSVPAINARPNEMLALIQEGNYYGHPNPSRGEYVLNGGNPTAGVDPREVTEYPVGVEPDPDFDSSLIYDTRSIGGTSPNGLTEYTGPGSLNGRLLVSFFSGARTIQSFELGADGLVAATEALQDTNGNNLQFNSPLDVAVHPSGRIYVADFGFAQSNPNGGNVRVLTPLAEASVIITPSNGSTDVSEAGITDSYTVALATQPNGPVTIAITPDGELTSDITNLIFTPTSWNSPQTVTVSAVDDSDIEGQHSGSISHSITSGSGDYGTGLAIASLTTTITDNDNLPPAAGVEIVETNGNTTVTEGGNSDSLSIRLTAAPTDNVVLSLIPDGQLDLGPANSGTVDLTFTTTNWNQAQSITINAVDDSLVEGSHSGEINYDIASADEEYETLVIAPTTVEITDNNVPGVQILPTDGDTIVTEGGPQDSYEVVLTTRPRGNVNIDLAFDNSQLTSNTSRVIFTPANWDIPRVVQVRAIKDALIEGTTISTISHIVSSGDSNFDGLTAADLGVTIADSIPPGVQILPTDGDTIVTEGGPQDNYEIVLTARPRGNVNIDLAFDNSQLTSNTSRVIFTPANWDIPKVVQVRAIEDALTEGTTLSTISHIVSSGDSNFDGLTAADLDVTIADAISPGVQILPTDGDTSVTEGGPQDSYEIVLTARPRGNVNIDLAFDNSQLTSNTSRVIFTPANWDIPKVVQVRAIEDALTEGTTLSTISHIVSSGDSNFDGLTAADLDVTIADAIPPGVQILPTDGDTIVTEGGPQDSYEIVLTARPRGNVNIDLAFDNSQLASNTSRVIFTPANWDIPKVVQVRAIEDALTEGTTLSTISHIVSSGDSNFDGLTAADLDVTIADSLPPGVQILPTDGDTIVTEGGPQDSYEVVLTARPISNVNIDLALDSSQLTSNTSRVIFTPANWNLPQVVQVQAIDDALTEDTALSTISHVVSSGDSNFDGLDAANLDVVVVDNDLSNGGNALFVAGSSGLSGSDAIARDLLISKGYSVTVVDDDFSQTSDANGQNLILISQTVQSTKVNTKFTNTAVPIIVWESFLYDDLGMANGFGFIPSGSSITLTNSSHPLSGGLPTGNTPIYSGSGSLGWGDPTNNNAISIAHTGNPNQLAVFGYEQGVTMDGLVAPEKRIGLSFWENPDNQGNNEALLDAAIDWAIS